MSCPARTSIILLVAMALTVPLAASISLQATDSLVTLTDSRHEAMWTREGFRFEARGGPAWEWILSSVRAGETALQVATHVAPAADRDQRRVDYAAAC